MNNNENQLRIDNLIKTFNKEKVELIFEIMKNMVKTNLEIKDKDLCAIIDKLIDREISYNDISGFHYIYAINLWNTYITDSNINYNLLIDTKNLAC